VLVNNAGMRLYQTVIDASEESWDAILGVKPQGLCLLRESGHP
jgi:NADP-dependent 3-hydroxy acid dehydrogenase YdfG